MKINLSKTITRFITEARKRGFSDFQIRQELKRKNYPENLTIKCFDTLQPKFKIKNQICIFLSNEILTSLEKRAKKNLLTIEEQIEDIIQFTIKHYDQEAVLAYEVSNHVELRYK